MENYKEYEINMVVFNKEDKYSLDEISDMFVDWCISKEILSNGGIKECVDGDYNKSGS